jgi:hypothetical protein
VADTVEELDGLAAHPAIPAIAAMLSTASDGRFSDPHV